MFSAVQHGAIVGDGDGRKQRASATVACTGQEVLIHYFLLLQDRLETTATFYPKVPRQPSQTGARLSAC